MAPLHLAGGYAMKDPNAERMADVEILLEHGADPNLMDSQGRPVLDYLAAE
jgi:hypothetical protein